MCLLVLYLLTSTYQDRHCYAISGYAYLLNGGAITWSSHKQELVTLSTAEAEYVTATHAAKEGLWLCRFLGEVFQPLLYPTTLHCDNQATITLSLNGRFHAHTKHIDMCYHFTHFTVDCGSLWLIYCPTAHMVADTLTKALPSLKAKHFTHLLGLHTIWGGVLNKKLPLSIKRPLSRRTIIPIVSYVIKQFSSSFKCPVHLSDLPVHWGEYTL